MIQKTKPFKAVSMPCTEEQFNEKLKPILEFFGERIHDVNYEDYKDALFFTNNYNYSNGLCSNTYAEMGIRKGDSVLDEFCPKTFIEALGYDYEQVLKAMPTTPPYKGQIKDFPKEIVEKMLERQFEQTGKKDISVFEASCTECKIHGGFNWVETIEGKGFWEEVLVERNFDLFFRKCPKDSKPHSTHFKIIRPILFFAKEDVVHRKTLRKYFTKKAIKSLVKHEYIKYS